MGWLRIREIAESVRRRFAPIERPDPVLAMAQKRVVLRDGEELNPEYRGPHRKRRRKRRRRRRAR